MTTAVTSVTAQKRTPGLAKSAMKSLRTKGLVPGILYGKSVKPLEIQLDAKALPKGHTKAGLVSLNLDGTTHTALMREVQVDTMTHEVLHIDFQEVKPEELVKVRVPVSFVGLTREQEKEGSFRIHVRSIPVQCKVKDIPDAIEVNISHLKVEGSSYLGDITLDSKVRIKGQKNMALATLAKL